MYSYRQEGGGLSGKQADINPSTSVLYLDQTRDSEHSANKRVVYIIIVIPDLLPGNIVFDRPLVRLPREVLHRPIGGDNLKVTTTE